MTTQADVGYRIKERRKEIKLAQSDFAEAIGMAASSRTTIAKWERGDSSPNVTMIPLICKALDCDAGYLFGEFDTPHKEAQDIMKQTSFSSHASEKIFFYSRSERPEKIGSKEDIKWGLGKEDFWKFINDLLESPSLEYLTYLYSKYKQKCSEYNSIIENNEELDEQELYYIEDEELRDKEFIFFRLNKEFMYFVEPPKDKK